ncbi:hypothetical protein BDA96_01G465800 [Sorghum bicolor]|uniref:Uncharacterized protein n=1 Tax=Sorghum bicolor TaxID=4558 RepID=A0A921V0X0_SORBI|nr:hypothetical protein BDA96_01G465800 [Sorghum bicolor]
MEEQHPQATDLVMHHSAEQFIFSKERFRAVLYAMLSSFSHTKKSSSTHSTLDRQCRRSFVPSLSTRYSCLLLCYQMDPGDCLGVLFSSIAFAYIQCFPSSGLYWETGAHLLCSYIS